MIEKIILLLKLDNLVNLSSNTHNKNVCFFMLIVILNFEKSEEN